MRFTGFSTMRRVVLRLTVGSFSIAAFIGIAALLVPGRMGALQGRILMTTLVVGATNILMLCYLAAGATRNRWPGIPGGLAAVVAAACALDIFWGHWQQDPGPWLLKIFGVSAIVALTLAQFSLLLVVVSRRSTVVHLMRATVAVGTMLAGLLTSAVLGWHPGDAGARLIGVVAILDVLGTVAVIAIGVFSGDHHPTSGPLTVVVPEPLAIKLRARAESRGQDPAELVVEAVTRYVESADV